MPSLRALNRRIVFFLRQSEPSQQSTDSPVCSNVTETQISKESADDAHSELPRDLPSDQNKPNHMGQRENTDEPGHLRRLDAAISTRDTALSLESKTSPRKLDGTVCRGPTVGSKRCHPVQRLPYIRGFPATSHNRPEPMPKPSTLMEESKLRTSNHLENPVIQREKIVSAELEAKMNSTRQAFVLRARHYMGCLYRKEGRIRPGQFIGNGTEDPDLYLDCCGLVRRCVQDLKSDFGFELGPWNQGYMFDTLPIKTSAQDLVPGDLIFIQGRYRDAKKKRPPHDIVHVEIFVGGRSGARTLQGLRLRWHQALRQ